VVSPGVSYIASGGYAAWRVAFSSPHEATIREESAVGFRCIRRLSFAKDTHVEMNESKLRPCPNCGTQVSKSAVTCPECGCRFRRQILAGLFAAAIIGLIIAFLFAWWRLLG
jgi:hypothetical protein